MICSDSVLTIVSMIEGSDYLCTFPKELYRDPVRRWDFAQAAVPSRYPDITLAPTTQAGRVPTIAALAFEEVVQAVASEPGFGAS